MAIEKVRRNGPYAPLSATYYQDDDIAEAGEAAELLYLRGLAFCAGRPTDGFISDTQVVRFVGVGLDDVQDRAKRLVEVGLWERVDGGYVVRAWLKWNASAEELGQYRARDRDRKRSNSGARAVRAEAEGETKTTRMSETKTTRMSDVKSSARKPSGSGADSERTAEEPSRTGPEADTTVVDFPRGLRSESDAHYTSLHDTSLHEKHTPLPSSATRIRESEDPVSSGGRRSRASPRRRTPQDIDTDPHFIAFWTAYPRKVDKGHARKAWAAKVNAGVDPQAIAEGAAHYRDNPRRPTEPRFIPHPSTWINGERWADDDRTTRPARAATAAGGSWWDN